MRYQNILVTPRDLTKTHTPTDQSTKEYLENPGHIYAITLEKYWIASNINTIPLKIFPLDFHYIPTDPTKTRTFYEFILVDTDSVEISHTKDKENNIQFSKMKVLNILSPQDWKVPLYETRSFTRRFSPQQYNYYDYMDAWSKVLLIKPGTYSWFIWFKGGISLKFPKWFVDYGPLPSIFLEEVQEVYTFFKQNSSFVLGYNLISFIASQTVTWIMAWEYTIQSPYEGIEFKVLIRKIKIKWWKKFNINLICKNKIQEWITHNSLKTTTPLKQIISTRKTTINGVFSVCNL